ncbi:hypothetical protein, partial [Mycobacterium asiaticum]|uniref:hypothetical protein n=1 Tax=Mycobacterium asiaticum TaxID=1790 RepID=UPI001C12C7AE
LKQHLKTLTGIHLHDPSRSARRHNPILAATTDKSGPRGLSPAGNASTWTAKTDWQTYSHIS